MTTPTHEPANVPEDIRKAVDDLLDAAIAAEDDTSTELMMARAMLAERERHQWQPIDAAPKDGGWLFLFVPGHGPARARWSQRMGWQSHNNNRFITKATHWMPLPESPKGGAE